jgi:hypothetical protein
VLVDFSEQTCPGSIAEAPALRSHYNAYHSRGLEVEKTTDFPVGYIVDGNGIIRNRFKGSTARASALRWRRYSREPRAPQLSIPDVGGCGIQRIAEDASSGARCVRT